MLFLGLESALQGALFLIRSSIFGGQERRGVGYLAAKGGVVGRVVE